MRTALIIEDSPEEAAILAQMVTLQDFRPVVSGTGNEGLMLARRIFPSVILLDITLPDTDGFDICLKMRSDPTTRAMPIIMVTAKGEPPERQKGYRVGANAYVTKPFSADDISDALKAAMTWRTELENGKIHGEIHVELHSESPLLQEVNEFLTGLCRETPLAADKIAHLRQAIMEMGQNAIEWGNRYRVEDLVTIRYRVFDDRVEILIRDQGPGFNPGAVPHAADPDDPIAHMDVREMLGLREGGFGMMISRGMLDDLRYNAMGNEVTLVKRFDPVPGG